MIFWKPNETPEERRLREEFEAQMAFTKRLYEAAKKGDSSTPATGGGSTGAAASGAGASSGPIGGARVEATKVDGSTETATTDENGLTSLTGEYTKVVATGGVDQITGDKNEMVLEARGGVNQCTPLNTIIGHCFDLFEGEIKRFNKDFKDDDEDEIELPKIEMIYSQFFHPESVESIFGVALPSNISNKTSSNTKYYSEDNDVAKLLTVLNAMVGENVKYAAKHIVEIYNLATDSSKTEADGLDAVYKGIALKWFSNTGSAWTEQYKENLSEGGSNANFEIRRAFAEPKEVNPEYGLRDYSEILNSVVSPLEVPISYEFTGLAGPDKEGKATPISLPIDAGIKAKGATGLEIHWKGIKEGGGHDRSVNNVMKSFRDELLKDNDDSRSVDGEEISAGKPVTFRSPKYVKSNVIGLKQAFKESFDSMKSKYYSKKDKFNATYDVEHVGETLSKAITWNRAATIDNDLLGESSSWAVIIPGVLALARTNSSNKEFYNPYVSTGFNSDIGVAGASWFRGTAASFFETVNVETRISFYEKAIRQTLSTHENHLQLGSTYDPYFATGALNMFKDGDIITLYSAYNDTFYQVDFGFQDLNAETTATITTFSGKIYRTPHEVSVVENLKLGIAKKLDIAAGGRLEYREVWKKKSKSARNLSKIEKYEDIRSSVDSNVDLWKTASDSVRTLPSKRNNPNSLLSGALIEYTKYEGIMGMKGEPVVFKDEIVEAFDLDTSHIEENNSHQFIHDVFIMPPFSGENAEDAESHVLRQGVAGSKILKGAIVSTTACSTNAGNIVPFKKYAPAGK